MPRQAACHEIPERQPRHIGIIITDMEKIHRHIKDIIHPLFIAKARVEDTG